MIALTDFLVALERLERGALDDRGVVAREVVLVEEVLDLLLDELDQLLVVDHVDLVEEDDHVGHVHLLGEQDVLPRLRHRAVSGGHDQDRAVHLGGARDHVLHVVGVTGAVDVGVVAVLRLVLDVRGRDRDPALLLLGRVVDLVEGLRLAAAGLREHLRDRSRQRGLAVVDVTDGADVHVRLAAIKSLCHLALLAPFSSVSVFGFSLSVEPGKYSYAASVASPDLDATISSAMLPGTSSYRSNCIE